MADTVTAEQVEAAGARLREIKENGTTEEKAAAMQELAELRMAYRQQEEAGGRRSGVPTIGGDAVAGEGDEG